jgi:hypothetical protein
MSPDSGRIVIEENRSLDLTCRAPGNTFCYGREQRLLSVFLQADLR